MQAEHPHIFYNPRTSQKQAKLTYWHHRWCPAVYLQPDNPPPPTFLSPLSSLGGSVSLEGTEKFVPHHVTTSLPPHLPTYSLPGILHHFIAFGAAPGDI